MSHSTSQNLHRVNGWFSLTENDLREMIAADAMGELCTFQMYGHVNGHTDADMYMDTYAVACADVVARRLLREQYGMYGVLGDERMPVLHMCRMNIDLPEEDLQDPSSLSSKWTLTPHDFREAILERRRVVLDSNSILLGMCYLKLYPEYVELEELNGEDKEARRANEKMVRTLALNIPIQEDAARSILADIRTSELWYRYKVQHESPILHTGDNTGIDTALLLHIAKRNDIYGRGKD